MKKQMQPGDLYNAHKAKMSKKRLSGMVSRMTKWPGGINDVRLNKSGSVGTEPIVKGDKKYTEIKLGRLGKIDVPMGKMKKRSKKVKLVPPSRGHKPKGAHGRAAVKAIGRTKTTGNFDRIKKAKGKGAAIAAYQNVLKAHQGKKTSKKSMACKHGKMSCKSCS